MPFVLLRRSAELCHKFFFVYNKAFVRAFADLLVLVGGGNFKNKFAPFNGGKRGGGGNFFAHAGSGVVRNIYQSANLNKTRLSKNRRKL